MPLARILILLVTMNVCPAVFGQTRYIVVKSNPSGAEVFIDGKATGKSTPTRLEIPIDRRFEIRLRKENYLDYIKFDLSSETLGTTLNCTLVKVGHETPNLIIVNSIPSGAEVLIDGKDSGEVTPTRLKVPTDRKFEISLRKTGYLEHTISGLSAGQVGRSITATLKKAP